MACGTPRAENHPGMGAFERKDGTLLSGSVNRFGAVGVGLVLRKMHWSVNMALSPNMITAALLGVPMLCYFGAAVNEYWRSNLPIALTMAAYAVGNVGLIWASWK